MKKLFTVLAVLLVASVAFAAVISGTVKAQYAFDFDKRTIAYTKPGVSGLDATLAFDPTEALIIGAEDAVHIEAKVSAQADFVVNYGNNHDTDAGYMPLKHGTDYLWYREFKSGSDTALGTKVLYAGVALSVDTFKIVGKNWSVDLKNGLALDFAKSAIDSKRYHRDYAEDNTQYYDMSNTLKDEHNLTATFFGYSVGFGMKSSDWTESLTFAVSGKTPEYDFSGVKAQFGAGYQVINKEWKLAASAKAAYATDKVSVSGAYDALYEREEEYIYNDVAVKVAVDPVAVDVYFNNDGASVRDGQYKYFGTTWEPIWVSNYLSAKVVVDVAKVAENVPVTVKLTGKNLLGDETQIFDAEASTTIVPNFEFGVYFNDWFDFDATSGDARGLGKGQSHRKLGGTVEFTGVQNVTLNGEVAYAIARDDANKKLFVLVGASYAHELFTVSAKAGLEKVYEKDSVLGAALSAKSTKLVDGAELSAKALFNINDLSDTVDEKAENSLTLACKVTF